MRVYLYLYTSLTVSFPQNLGKPAPERKAILDFKEARDDGVARA